MSAIDVGEFAEEVSLEPDGIWRTTVGSDVSYPESGHSACLAVEEGSFWFNHRNDCIRALVTSFPPAPGRPMLDVGGGNGYVSLALERAGIEVVLLEPGESGALNAKRRGLEHVICATTHTAGIRPGSIGAIGLFDVIEHVADDRAFMDEMGALLPTDGRIYATVPAHQSLWSADDERAGHHRRYAIDEIVALFGSAGFEVDYASYYFRPLPLPVLLFRTIPHRLRSRRGRAGSRAETVAEPADNAGDTANSTARSHAVNASWTSTTLRRVLHPEVANIERGTPMRFGASVILAAHRR